MARPDGRAADELRPVTMQRGFMKYPEGSCLISFGNTKVICTASVEERVPPFLKNSGQGWVTAEYSMLPRSCKDRNQRDTRGPGGRTMEIQRLVGRCLRGVVDMRALGERTIYLDCDVLQGDGGTRTAAITGSFVALFDALRWMQREKMIKQIPLTSAVAAISVGVVGGEPALDLCYIEDKDAGVDMNIVMTDRGKFIEVQGTAEGSPYDRDTLNRLLDLAHGGIKQLFKLQKDALDAPIG